MDYEQFYSTPPEIAQKLISMLTARSSENLGMILEPSAGTGALIEGLKECKQVTRLGYEVYRWSNISSSNIHCIELNPQRASFLKDNDYKVIWDDFLTFNSLMPYNTIIMNPPFHEGAKHLLKALRICVDGGEIVCILNAETIKNPFSNERKQLLKELNEQEQWKYEIIKNAFRDAERPSDVEIALVYVKKKAFDGECIILDKFKKFVVTERKQQQDQSLMRYGEIASLVDTHDAEVLAAIALFDEIQNYNKVALKDSKHDDGIFEIKIAGDSSRFMKTPHAAIVRRINLKYWKRLFTLDDISHLMTSEIRNQYYSKISDMADFDFNERNILQLKEDLTRSFIVNIDRAIMKVFDQFTHKYSYEENSENIHYYNGWKTNKAFYCNKKVILPLNAFHHYSACTIAGRHYDSHVTFDTSNIQGQLHDIELAMNYLDSGHTNFPADEDMCFRLSVAQDIGKTKNISTKFFDVTLYKKGTAHLVFKDLELLKKFNIYAGRKKNWLPPSYGHKHYDEMDDEEKAVIDSFEGKDSYKETLSKRDFYLSQPVDSILTLHSSI